MPTLRSVQQKAQGLFHQAFMGDRRCKLYDLSKISPKTRKAQSPIIQFYSSVDNIGNYTPVLGIQKMLAHTTDTWCIHDRQIDFDFINTHYQCAIIGGAGLLHQCFEPFWSRFVRECKLPVIIWGVGVCLPDNWGVRSDLLDSTANTGVSRKTVAEVAKRCDLINVRDDLTANYYNLKHADISACPTIAYLEEFKSAVEGNSQTVLYSSHEELVSDADRQALKTAIAQLTTYRYTDNIQRPFIGLKDLITDYYCKSQLVISTRLHGTIFAYGLGIPYIAIARDEKLRAFCRIYGNGISVKDDQELKEVLKTLNLTDISTDSIALEPVLAFGEQARRWASSYCSI